MKAIAKKDYEYDTEMEGRKIRVKDIDWHRSPQDTVIIWATYLDTNVDLTDEQLADLTEYEVEDLDQLWQERYGRGGEYEGHWRD